MLDWFKRVVEKLVRFQKGIVLMFNLILKEEVQMVDMYVALIIAGRRKLSQVPSTFREAVEKDLAALGLSENGQPVATE